LQSHIDKIKHIILNNPYKNHANRLHKSPQEDSLNPSLVDYVPYQAQPPKSILEQSGSISKPQIKKVSPYGKGAGDSDSSSNEDLFKDYPS
jgi:hypothetical protein